MNTTTCPLCHGPHALAQCPRWRVPLVAVLNIGAALLAWLVAALVVYGLTRLAGTQWATWAYAATGFVLALIAWLAWTAWEIVSNIGHVG